MIKKRSLKHWRQLNNLTQKELAEKTGISDKTISVYENDIEQFKKTSYANVEKLADALNISVDNFNFF